MACGRRNLQIRQSSEGQSRMPPPCAPRRNNTLHNTHSKQDTCEMGLQQHMNFDDKHILLTTRNNLCM